LSSRSVPIVKLCSKPSCARPGAAMLAYDYAARLAVLEDPAQGAISPHLYPLCGPCAEQLRPPRGWDLVDLRSIPRLFVPSPELEKPAERRAAAWE
jgi:hypothetical protein